MAATSLLLHKIVSPHRVRCLIDVINAGRRLTNYGGAGARCREGSGGAGCQRSLSE